MAISKFQFPSLKESFLFFLSLVIVGFGQPAWSGWFGIIAGFLGYGIFWSILLNYESPKKRFWISALWFFSVQLIQLSWFISHPYIYIYAIYFLLSFAMGLQFGCLGLFITRKEICNPFSIFAIAGFWILMEWGRLFVLSGFSWNPVGIALTSSIYGMQMASLGGVFLLSFWVIFVNLLAIKAWAASSKLSIAVWLTAAFVPYAYGAVHLYTHQNAFTKHEEAEKDPFNAVLVQTAFPIEESLPFWDTKKMISFVFGEWNQILKMTKKHLGKPVDLIVFPEFTVPYGTYNAIFPFQAMKASVEREYGKDALNALPPLAAPLALQRETKEGAAWFVSNAYWLQAISNIFQSHIIIGLEDADEGNGEGRKYFSAAQYFQPSFSLLKNQHEAEVPVQRYEKRVLVPMGEYIPFTFCQKLAAEYGIQGSFTCGEEAKVMGHPKVPFGISICYEETFGHIMRESRQKGAKMLVNLTSDVWYPNSRLTKQHFDHARLRTVENGIPLIRACNTGITGGFDSLGRVVAVLGENYWDAEWVADSIHFTVPQYTYATLYSRTGDLLIVVISIFAILFRLWYRPSN